MQTSFMPSTTITPSTEKPHGYDWVLLYYDWALKQFEVNYNISKLLWEINDAQFKSQGRPLDYRLEVQKYLKLIEEEAYYMQEEIVQQCEMLLVFWVAAEKYMGSLTALSIKFLNAGFHNQEVFQKFLEVFPSKVYCRKVKNLALAMSRYASQQTQTMVPVSYFWPAAEYHIITAIAGAATTAQQFQDAETSLIQIFNFSADRYLKFIQEVAYYKWKNAGEPCGEPLRDWLESENEVLAQLQRGERISGLTDTSPLENQIMVDGKTLESKSDADGVQGTSLENEGVK